MATELSTVLAQMDSGDKWSTFTKYGTIEAKVTHVSHDAVNDEKRGLVFPARATIQVENKIVNLTPGMAVTVEIKTAKRRVIEYFLAPLLQYKDESLREH